VVITARLVMTTIKPGIFFEHQIGCNLQIQLLRLVVALI
jgi:hypothetical protein